MKKTNILIGILLVSIVAFLGQAVFLNKEETFPQRKEEIIQNVQQKVSLIINSGEGNPETFQADFREGMTAFDLLKEKTTEAGIELGFKNYDFGIFIESIGVVKGGNDNKYWLYYVNDTAPMVSADKYALSAGDKLEFKFEASPF